MSNLLADLPDARGAEVFETLLARPGARIERIVSWGQVTPAESPFLQDHDEWVLVLAGAARLWLDGSGEVALGPGDHVLVPAGVSHRVTWTSDVRETVWLAVHFEDH